MRQMFGARSFLSALFQAWPRNSLQNNIINHQPVIMLELGSWTWAFSYNVTISTVNIARDAKLTDYRWRKESSDP